MTKVLHEAYLCRERANDFVADAPALLCAPGTALLVKYAHVKGILRGICLFESCGQAITGSEDAFRAHMGKHELHHKFGTGLHQPKDTDDVQVGDFVTIETIITEHNM